MFLGGSRFVGFDPPKVVPFRWDPVVLDQHHLRGIGTRFSGSI